MTNPYNLIWRAARACWAVPLAYLMLVGLGTAHAQTTPPWQSALALAHPAATGTSRIQATAIDAATGAVFVTGHFTGQITFGATSLVSVGSRDMFVACYDPDLGSWAWARSGGSTAYAAGSGIATDGQGGVYVTGGFNGSMTFAGQPLLNSFSTEVFVAAYAAADGSSRWARSDGGAGSDSGSGIAADGQGGVYVTGSFQNRATFAGQPALSGTDSEVFVAAYAAADGNCRWAKSGGGFGDDIGNAIAVDGQGGVYVTGEFRINATFAGQPALNGGFIEMFVAAYAAADGSGRWAKSGGGPQVDVGSGIAADGQGGVYVTGSFNLGATIANGSATFAGQPALHGAGPEVFVAAYAAADGSGRWATSGGGPNIDYGYAIAADRQGLVYVTGLFGTSATFAGQPALSGTGTELFVAAYSAANGSGQWAKSGNGAGTIYGYGIATDGTRLFVGGWAWGGQPVAFDALLVQSPSMEMGLLAEIAPLPQTVALASRLPGGAQASVRPNPAAGRFTLALPGVAGVTSATATLVNTLGQVLSVRTLPLPAAGTTATYDTNTLAAGVYALRVQMDGQTATLRVVVE